MNDNIKKTIDEMSKIYKRAKKDFKFESDYSKIFLALTCATEKIEYDKELIKNISAKIKSETGIFSAYRGSILFAISFLLSTKYKNPFAKVEILLNNNKKFKEKGFKNQSYLALANYILLSNKNENYTQVIDKASSIYDQMKSNHRFLTSVDDYPMAIILALSNKAIDTNEEYYERLDRNGFRKSNGLQLLSHILSLSQESINSVVEKVLKLKDDLKNKKIRFNSNIYPIIGLLTMISSKNDEIGDDLKEIISYIKRLKGYRMLDRNFILLIATILIYNNKKEKNDLNQSIIETTVSVIIETIIQMQTMMIISAVSATTVNNS